MTRRTEPLKWHFHLGAPRTAAFIDCPRCGLVPRRPVWATVRQAAGTLADAILGVLVGALAIGGALSLLGALLVAAGR